MKIIKITNKQVELYNSETGGRIRSIGSKGVVDAALSSDEKLIVITYENGSAEIYNVETNAHRATPAKSRAVRASFQGDRVLVTLDNGKVELRSQDGGHITTY